ncbi:MAG: hypothetical protein WBD25_08770, partial [Terriglobales bacterium]
LVLAGRTGMGELRGNPVTIRPAAWKNQKQTPTLARSRNPVPLKDVHPSDERDPRSSACPTKKIDFGKLTV